MINLKMSTIDNGHYHPLHRTGTAARPDAYVKFGVLHGPVRALPRKPRRPPRRSCRLPQGPATQWQRKIDTFYADLSEKEMESDWEQVRKYLPTIIDALGT